MTERAQRLPLDLAGESGDWLDELAPLVSMAALAVLGFLWLIVVTNALGFDSRLRSFTIFATSFSALPAACAVIQYWGDRDHNRAAGALFESINLWCAVLALLGLAAVGIVSWATGRIEIWQLDAPRATRAILGFHLSLLLVLLGLTFAAPTHLKRAHGILLRLCPRWAQTATLVYALAATVLTLFRIEPGNKHFNGLFGIFFPYIPGGFPGPFQTIAAVLIAGLWIVFGGCLLVFEQRVAQTNAAALSRIQRSGLAFAALAAALVCFDFSLATDAFHYMTNVGPALHLISGGTLMVDTFSQYGLGPVLLTYLAFQFSQPSFAVANIAVQACNILFYVLFLTALWQGTRHRLTALWLGLMFLLFWLSGWAYGDGNVNVAPSVLGFRYLPPMFMLVALGAAAESRRHSFLTFAASLLAAFWSAEAIAGVLFLHCGFLAFTDLRDRRLGTLVVDVVLACLPIVIGLTAMSLGMLLVSGKLPAFAIYLGYFSSYNPVATFWAVPFDGLFWGWVPILLSVAIVIATCCIAVIVGRPNGLPDSATHWLRWRLPAALLTVLTAAYFAGRSVDFVILIALLPFSLLLIPALLWLARIAISGDRIAMSLLAVPLIAFLWISSFSLLYLFRVGAPYSLVVQECRDHGRCTPAALGRGVWERLRRQREPEPRPDVWTMSSYDLEIAADAKRLIDRFAGQDTAVTVLLGESGAGSQMLSEVALMYAGKWHQWPRSFTFTDELVPALASRILATPVTLRTGNLVILRRDETNLGHLESGILKLVRSSGSLCLLDGSTSEVAAYRFWKNGDQQPADECVPVPANETHISDAEKELLRALPAFIDNIQRHADVFPDGRIDITSLERANVEIPPLLVRGGRLVSYWGPADIYKSGRYLTLDFFGVRYSVCRILLTQSSQISGVIRVATSATLADEQEAPVSSDQAAQACVKYPGFMRLIVDAHP